MNASVGIYINFYLMIQPSCDGRFLSWVSPMD